MSRFSRATAGPDNKMASAATAVVLFYVVGLIASGERLPWYHILAMAAGGLAAAGYWLTELFRLVRRRRNQDHQE